MWHLIQGIWSSRSNEKLTSIGTRIDGPEALGVVDERNKE